MSKYVAYALMGLLIVSGLLATKTASAQEWYVGDGVQKGLLVKYSIATLDYKRGQQFEATLWFSSEDDKHNWITDVVVVEKGKAACGKLTLSSLTLTPLGTVSPDVQPYREAITSSIGWLGGYASKIAQKSLTGGAWGVIGAIGGGSTVVQAMGTEKIQAAGQEWDTSIIGWSRGEVSQIWIKDGFPFPIKAKVYAFVTQQPIPVQYEFQLLETRVSDTPPECPTSLEEAPTPPLSTSTTTTIFNVDLWWEPISIEPGKPTKFGVVIFDQQGNIEENVRYKLTIKDAKGDALINNEEFLAEAGQGEHMVTFEEAGPATVTVNVLGGPEIFEQKVTELANFELLVVPEFPIGITLVMASLVAMMVAITRFKKIGIPKL